MAAPIVIDFCGILAYEIPDDEIPDRFELMRKIRIFGVTLNEDCGIDRKKWEMAEFYFDRAEGNLVLSDGREKLTCTVKIAKKFEKVDTVE